MNEIKFELPKGVPAPPQGPGVPRVPGRGTSGRSAVTVRAFPSDLAEMTRRAEEARRQTPPELPKARPAQEVPDESHHDSHMGKFILILSLALAFAIGVGAYVLIGVGGKKAESPVADTTPKDTTGSSAAGTQIFISDSPREQILADIQIFFGGNMAGGDTVEFMVKDAAGERAATTQEFLSAIGLTSYELGRPLDPDLVFGAYTKSGETVPGYLILKSTSPEETFAALYSGEPRMVNDLLPIVNPLLPRSEYPYLLAKQFRDKPAGGLDSRFISDISGTPVLLYAEAPGGYFIIAGSEHALGYAADTLAKE